MPGRVAEKPQDDIDLVVAIARWNVETHLLGFERSIHAIAMSHLNVDFVTAAKRMNEANHISNDLMEFEHPNGWIEFTYNAYLWVPGELLLLHEDPDLRDLYEIARPDTILSSRERLACRAKYRSDWLVDAENTRTRQR